MSDYIDPKSISYNTKFKIGDIVRLINSDRTGRVTKISKEINPEDFTIMFLAYVEWDRKSIIITDGSCHDRALELVIRVQEDLI